MEKEETQNGGTAVVGEIRAGTTEKGAGATGMREEKMAELETRKQQLEVHEAEFAAERTALAVQVFAIGILAATFVLGWFVLPPRLPLQWGLQGWLVCRSVVLGDMPEIPGRAVERICGSPKEDLIPEGAAKLVLLVLAAGSILLLREVSHRHGSAWRFGHAYQIAALAAVAGNAVNRWVESSGDLDIVWDILCTGGILAAGIWAGFGKTIRSWFAGGEDGGSMEPLGFFRWGLYGGMGLAATAALFMGGRVVGVYRHVGLSTRDSLAGRGQVLVIRNHGEKSALCAIEIGDFHCERFVVGDVEKEFGALETGQALTGGTEGRLSVAGCRRGIRFRVSEDKSFFLSGNLMHSLGKRGTAGFEFTAEPPIAFGQAPSRIGGAVLEVENTSGKETVRGTLSVNGGEATADVNLGPGERRTFGRLELFRALRKGDRVEVSLTGFSETARYEIGDEKKEVPLAR